MAIHKLELPKCEAFSLSTRLWLGRSPCVMLLYPQAPPLMTQSERKRAMQQGAVEALAKKGEIQKIFTCIVLHQMKNSNPQDPICN